MPSDAPPAAKAAPGPAIVVGAMTAVQALVSHAVLSLPAVAPFYDYELRMIERVAGGRQIASLKAEDFIRWHKAAAASVEGGDGLRKAQSFIKRLRAIISFGVVAEIKACERVDMILSKMRFATPSSRSAIMTYDMAVAIIAKAHEAGRPSIALAQAIQFETGMRQTDVIGQYEPCALDSKSPYRVRARQWVPGLLWQDIDEELVLTFKTSKTGATVTHSLGAMALVRAEIDRIPRERRIGPVIVNETSGLPYMPFAFQQNWRKIARAAGVPDSIWNRDSRAGALSEGDEAGADLSKLQRMAGHTTSKMTSRYVRGRAAETSAEIAHLRSEKRERR